MEKGICSPIRELTRGTKSKIKVHVLKKWENIDFNTHEVLSLDITLIDEEGDQIHASIPKDYMSIHGPKLTEGEAFYIENFDIGDPLGFHRPVVNEKKMIWRCDTFFKKANEKMSVIPKFKFAFMEFEDAKSRFTENNKHLIDVIDRLTILGRKKQILRKDGHETTLKELTIENTRGMSMRVSLFGNASEQISEEIAGDPETIVIIIIASACLRKFGFLSTSICLVPVEDVALVPGEDVAAWSSSNKD
ncbi:uncharacterized protein LOC113351979 [Papaver somniferum]|uniref:uncharacterized protein LOC113351979 n=1 Tax=Papaver somniferum TaxID=3469 RepID=UPI000E701C75|nr:uncharacterized protein LOC113351979 [Papaver somniferum]